VAVEAQAAPAAGLIGRLRTWIPIAMGVISVAGALVTWRAVQLGSDASSADQQAIIDASIKQRAQVRTEVQLRFEQSQFARYRGLLAAADFLQKLGSDARGTGDEATARSYENQSSSLRQEAESLATLTFPGIENYIVGEGNQQHFDTDKRRDELAREDQEAFELDPNATARQADELRRKSLRLIGTVSLFALSVLILSIANLQTGSRRLSLAVAGVALFAVASVNALILGI
jgi:hypothetical protein